MKPNILAPLIVAAISFSCSSTQPRSDSVDHTTPSTIPTPSQIKAEPNGDAKNQPTPSPASVVPILQQPPSMEGISTENCRLKEVGRQKFNHSTGFPVDFHNLQPDQEVRLAVIAIDWPDFKAETHRLEEENEDVRIFVDYYQQISQGQLTFKVDYAIQWYTLPETIDRYPQRQVSDFNSKLAQHAITTADADFNFSEIDVVIFVLPEFPPIPAGVPQSTTEFASFQHFNAFSSKEDPRMIFSEEGWVRNYVGAGFYFDDPDRPKWSYYIHEVAHMFSLPDLYMKEANFNLGTQQHIDIDYSIGPMNVWSVMSTQDGPSRTFESWSRFLMGWLTDDQVICYDIFQFFGQQEVELELLPLDVYDINQGIKTVIIKTGIHTALVVESRRPIFLDEKLTQWEIVGRAPQGIIVYQVDVTKNDGEGPLVLVLPEGQKQQAFYTHSRSPALKVDALYNVGSIGETDLLSIELLKSEKFDKVRISLK